MNLTFLDAATMGVLGSMPEPDLELGALEKLGHFTAYPTTTPEQLLERAQGQEILITNKVVLGSDTLPHLPQLRLIVACATGTDHIDIATCQARGITVCNVSGYSTATVAQHVIGQLINLAAKLPHYHQDIATWPESPIFTQLHHPVMELEGKTLGLIGYGKIGQAVGKIATSLGMKLQRLALGSRAHIEHPDLPSLAPQAFWPSCDAVSLHCPLNQETEGLICQETLTLLPKHALLINTGRGGLIVEEDLHHALKTGEIAGAALDVLRQEPPSSDHLFLTDPLPNLLLTPHSAWISLEARTRLLHGLVENITSFAAGDPVNVVKA